MTLANIVLEKLSEAKPATGRHELAFTDEASGDGSTNWSLYLVADRTDEMSVLAWDVKLRRPESKGEVAAWANRIAESCAALDPMKVIEIDAPRRQAMIRSANPTKRKDKLFYYEIILEGTGSALLRRFKSSNGGERRERMAFALTHEALGRLIEELTT